MPPSRPEQQKTPSSAQSQVDAALEDTFPASDPPASHLPDEPASNAADRWLASEQAHQGQANQGEVTINRAGKTYGATYDVEKGMLKLKTHTETRSVELSGREPSELARRTLDEIISAQPRDR